MKKKNYVGEIFGRLQIIQVHLENRNGNHKCLCRCECGMENLVFLNNLRTGRTKSCGCLLLEERPISEETKIKMSVSRTFSKEDINVIENLYLSGTKDIKEISAIYKSSYLAVIYVIKKMKENRTPINISQEEFDNIQEPYTMKKIRRNFNLSGYDVAEYLELSHQSIYQWETGQVKMSLAHKERIIEFYKRILRSGFENPL